MKDWFFNLTSITIFMFETISRSFGIVKKSFGVLMSEKKLLALPAISGVITLILIATFILPLSFLGDGSGTGGVPFYVMLFLFYFLSYFVVILFNSALIHAANNKIEGKPVSIKESLSVSSSNIVNIACWSLIAATVGLILNVLRGQARNQGGLGGIITNAVLGMIGMAWSFATFFVVPVLVFEKVGPFDAIKRSVSLIKKTWGENIVGGIGISLIFFVLYLIGIGCLLLGIFANMFWIVVPLVIAYFIAVFLVQGAVQAIFSVALYRYASNGQSAIFEEDDIKGAFKSK